jgi:hypothetical protein
MAKFTDGIFNQKVDGLEFTIKPESATLSRYQTTLITVRDK